MNVRSASGRVPMIARAARGLDPGRIRAAAAGGAVRARRRGAQAC